MAVAELSETSTKEEIESFVEEIAAARAGEQAPEPKSDAEIVSGLANNEVKDKTPAPTGEETAEAPAGESKQGKGETTDDRAWLDDDLKSEVAAYGIGE